MSGQLLVTDFGPYTPKIDPAVLYEAGVRMVVIKSSTDTRTVKYFEDNLRLILDDGRLVPTSLSLG